MEEGEEERKGKEEIKLRVNEGMERDVEWKEARERKKRD